MKPTSPQVVADLDPQTQLYYISNILRRGNASILDFAPLSSREVEESIHADMDNVLDEAILRYILALDKFEEFIHQICAPSAQVYILGDSSVDKLLHEFFGGDSDCPPTSHRRAIAELLHGCSIIYRLACSPKFGYDPAKFKQIRISGWGRSLCQCVLHSRTIGCPDGSEIKHLIVTHIEIYREIIVLCTDVKRPLDTKRIHALNDLIPIKIVT